MNLWARYDEEDRDQIHFSAQPLPVIGYRNDTRRLLATIHVDDLKLMFGDNAADDLRRRLENERIVFVWIDLNFEEE